MSDDKDPLYDRSVTVSDWWCYKSGTRVYGFKETCPVCGQHNPGARVFYQPPIYAAAQWRCVKCNARNVCKAAACWNCDTVR